MTSEWVVVLAVAAIVIVLDMRDRAGFARKREEIQRECAKRAVDTADLLALADELDAADVDGETGWGDRIRRALGKERV